MLTLRTGVRQPQDKMSEPLKLEEARESSQNLEPLGGARTLLILGSSLDTNLRLLASKHERIQFYFTGHQGGGNFL